MPRTMPEHIYYVKCIMPFFVLSRFWRRIVSIERIACEEGVPAINTLISAIFSARRHATRAAGLHQRSGNPYGLAVDCIDDPGFGSGIGAGAGPDRPDADSNAFGARNRNANPDAQLHANGGDGDAFAGDSGADRRVHSSGDPDADASGSFANPVASADPRPACGGRADPDPDPNSNSRCPCAAHHPLGARDASGGEQHCGAAAIAARRCGPRRAEKAGNRAASAERQRFANAHAAKTDFAWRAHPQLPQRSDRAWAEGASAPASRPRLRARQAPRCRGADGGAEAGLGLARRRLLPGSAGLLQSGL